ncbi:MAG: acetylxylan esterase [Planctomycetales bacterium]|nr:acetylxylan esterase [Planctomycetales bacterium]
MTTLLRQMWMFAFAVCVALPVLVQADSTEVGDKMIARYFAAETAKLANAPLNQIQTREDWEREQPKLRTQLLDMLGLEPLPEKTDLAVTVTGEFEHEQFNVKNLHFQSMPGLYVTANLYSPKNVTEKLPAVLYVCGHGPVIKDGISYGNKVHYHHHGCWFARNGYVCLMIDTLQMGEIEGIHHGTYREKMWWWLNRGYSSAGVEAWNGIRAIDYLQSLDFVDPERIGMTGRSGGGVYSWWGAATDERVKCAIPVAGITDLQNYVVDGAVEGHCDCMFMVNTHRWDYPTIAALVAPRPLLISNTDRDSLFPLDGVYRTYAEARRIYELVDAPENIALHITAGGHKDTQELRVHAFRWLNRHLKGDDSLITTVADKYFEPEQLRVFKELPSDQINTTIQESFVPVAELKEPATAAAKKEQYSEWRQQLMEKTFAGWPKERSPIKLKRTQQIVSETYSVRLEIWEFSPQPQIYLPLYVLTNSEAESVEQVHLNIVEQDDWNRFAARLNATFGDAIDVPLVVTESLDGEAWEFPDKHTAIVHFAPRGVGQTAWNQDERNHTHIRRRFYLLGQTWDGMRTYDIMRATEAIRSIVPLRDAKLNVFASQTTGVMTVYASIFEENIESLVLSKLPASHRNGPYLLNVRRIFDVPQAIELAKMCDHVKSLVVVD